MDADVLTRYLGPRTSSRGILCRIECRACPRVLVWSTRDDTRLGADHPRRGDVEAVAGRYGVLAARWGGSVLISALDETNVRDARFADEDVESAASAGSTFSSLPGQETADGTVAGAYIVINPRERDRVDEILLSHEITHVATAELGGYEPLWLAEGVAEYVSWRGVEAVSGSAEVVKWEQEIIDDSLPLLEALPSDTGFYDNTADVYGVSWLAVRHLIRSIGMDRLAELYEDLARNGIDQAARDRILLSRTGFTEASLFVSLKAYRPPR
jgi:hypothetical protein